MRHINDLGYIAAVASFFFVASAIGQTTTRCVTNAGVTTCDTSAQPASKPPLDYAKIMQQSGDLVPPYQPPRQEPTRPQDSPPIPLPGGSSTTSQGDYFQTGNGLLASCNSDDGSLVMACMGFLHGVTNGVADGIELAGGTQRYCIPPTVTLTQTKDVTIRWLKNHPEMRHLEAGVLVVMSMISAFPCTK